MIDDDCMQAGSMKKDPNNKATDLYAKKTRKARLRRLQIMRMRTASTNPPFPEKLEKGCMDTNPHSSAEVSDSSGRRSELSYGHVSMIGGRREMEDTVTVAPLGWLEGEYHFFAVYDGHGGAEVAKRCGERMHSFLASHVEKAKEKREEEIGLDWEKLMVECFKSMDEELGEESESRMAPAAEMTGSTAVVAVVGKEEVVLANCGDSRAVLCKGGVAVPLSNDHKPERADEKERIEAAGGRVLNWNGWRVQGVLSTSRSLGDNYLKPYVSSEPEVRTIRRSEADEFLILATDGLFNFVSNEIACKVVKRCFDSRSRRREPRESGPSEAAASLAELAIAKGSRDNISVIVVQLK